MMGLSYKNAIKSQDSQTYLGKPLAKINAHSIHNTEFNGASIQDILRVADRYLATTCCDPSRYTMDTKNVSILSCRVTQASQALPGNAVYNTHFFGLIAFFSCFTNKVWFRYV